MLVLHPKDEVGLTMTDDKKRDLLGTKAPIPEEMKEQVSHLRTAVEKNHTKTAYLDHYGVQVEAMAVFMARVEFIIDHAYPVNTPERIEFEMAWQAQVAEILAHYEGLLNRARLAGNAPNPSMAENVANGKGLILP